MRSIDTEIAVNLARMFLAFITTSSLTLCLAFR